MKDLDLQLTFQPLHHMAEVRLDVAQLLGGPCQVAILGYF
jgi:hypothetical protein